MVRNQKVGFFERFFSIKIEFGQKNNVHFQKSQKSFKRGYFFKK